MADSDATKFTYRAFISYSHKDQRWARWLIRKLEAYRVPRDLADAGQQRKLGTFFRDRDEAAAADDLATTIRKALETSQHLIVVASPASAKSAYVEREIREFAELNRQRGQRGRILTLIADGEPNADDPTQECLPAALRGALAGDDGAPIEPLAADARPTGDGKTRALAKLVAGLLGVRYDALVRRDLQRRRRFQAAVVGAACAVAVVAAGVGWKFETDRREREELAQARARAESDRRTVAAVSTAERAKVRLTAGDIDNAVRLARASLPDDGSLPFIPQAYSTLYAAYMNGGAPVDLDIQGGTYAFKTFTTPLSDGQYLSWNDGGNVRIWSPTRGVSYSTEFDAQSREPSVTPDEDAVFVPSLNGEMRYRVAARAWDEIDTIGLSDRIANVNAVLALDADTLLACVNDELMHLTLPTAGSGAPTVDWQQSIGTLGCDHLAVSDAAIFATANGGKVLQLDRKTRETIRTYESGTSLIDGLAVHGDRLAVQLIGKTLIFTIGTDDPPVTLETHGPSSAVSPDGRFAIESDIGASRIMIHDLASGETKTLDCDICRVMGFTGDTAIMMEDNKVVSHHLPDGEQIALLHQFADKVDEGLFFPERSTVIGIRQFGPSTVVRLDNQPKGILVAPSGGRKMFMSFAGFVNDEAIALVEAELGGEGIFRRTFGRIVRTNGQEAKPVWEAEITGTGPTGYGTIQPLGQDLILVRKNETMMSSPFSAEILDPFAGTTIFTGRLLNETETIADGRMLVEEASGLSLIDLAKRTVTPVADFGRSPGLERRRQPAADDRSRRHRDSRLRLRRSGAKRRETEDERRGGDHLRRRRQRHDLCDHLRWQARLPRTVVDRKGRTNGPGSPVARGRRGRALRDHHADQRRPRRSPRQHPLHGQCHHLRRHRHAGDVGGGHGKAHDRRADRRQDSAPGGRAGRAAPGRFADRERRTRPLRQRRGAARCQHGRVALPHTGAGSAHRFSAPSAQAPLAGRRPRERPAARMGCNGAGGSAARPDRSRIQDQFTRRGQHRE